MPKAWSAVQREQIKKELTRLYVFENKTITEIGSLLGIKATSVYARLHQLDIPSYRKLKPHSDNRRTDIVILDRYTPELAEFIGIMLGDGNLTHYQASVTLGKKDRYAPYVSNLMERLFGVRPKTLITKTGNQVVYLGSTRLTNWLLEMGLVFNKVRDQVEMPLWIKQNRDFQQAVLRGLFDTDGSIYLLKSRRGQISFCNRSRPLIEAVRELLVDLGFHPSRISGHQLYLTRKEDLIEFLERIRFANEKHNDRIRNFAKTHAGMVELVNHVRL